MYDARIINIFLQGMAGVLDSLGLGFERRELIQQAAPYHGSVRSGISIQAPTEGEILFEMDEGCQERLLAAMLLPPDAGPAMKRSALKELAGMVRGHVLTLYQQAGMEAELSELMIDEELEVVDSLERVASLCVGMDVGESHSMKIHFVLGQEYERCLLLRRMSRLSGAASGKKVV